MYVRTEKTTGQKKKEKPVDKQPAGKKPGTKKRTKPVDKNPE